MRCWKRKAHHPSDLRSRMVEAFAYAKVNLTLHVLCQRADGYHQLDSLVVFADVGDRIRFIDATELSVEVTGPFADGVPTDCRNLVWRAAEVVGARCHIVLEKNLPHGSGLGGGSADAAAVLRRFGGHDAAASIGADVPVCLEAGPQRMQGTGDVLERLSAVPACHLVLANPGSSVSTGEVFRSLRRKNRPGMGPVPDWKDLVGFTDWLRRQRNDLEEVAVELVPQVGDVLAALSGATVAHMTVSGTSCYGLYPDQGAAKRAAKEISGANPGWWVRDTVSFGGHPNQVSTPRGRRDRGVCR